MLSWTERAKHLYNLAVWRAKATEERKKREPAAARGHKVPLREASFFRKRKCADGQGRVTP